jgi:hypothetical protein
MVRMICIDRVRFFLAGSIPDMHTNPKYVNQLNDQHNLGHGKENHQASCNRLTHLGYCCGLIN